MRYWVCPTADHSLTCPGTWWQTAHLHCTPEGEERRGGEEREGRRGRGEGKKRRKGRRYGHRGNQASTGCEALQSMKCMICPRENEAVDQTLFFQRVWPHETSEHCMHGLKHVHGIIQTLLSPLVRHQMSAAYSNAARSESS